MHEEQRAAVLPMIELGRSYYTTAGEDGDRLRLRLYAENVGIGPARIIDFRVNVDGAPTMTWGAAMAALLKARHRRPVRLLVDQRPYGAAGTHDLYVRPARRGTGRRTAR